MKIGGLLKNRREKKALSQQEVADIIGVCQKTYSNMESDKTKPSIEQLYQLSKTLNFSIVEILTRLGFDVNK